MAAAALSPKRKRATVTSVPVVSSEPIQFSRGLLLVCGVKCDVGASDGGGDGTRCHYSRAYWFIEGRTGQSKPVYVRGHLRHICEVDALAYVGFCAICMSEVPVGTPPLLSTTPSALWGIPATHEPFVYLCPACRPNEKTLATLPAGTDAPRKPAAIATAVVEKAPAAAAVPAALRQLTVAIQTDVKQPPPEWTALIKQLPLHDAVAQIHCMLEDYKKTTDADATKRWHIVFHQLALRLLDAAKKKPKKK